MPTQFFPSEVVEYLDLGFPQAWGGGPFVLSSGDGPAASYLLHMLDNLPPGIVTLKGRDRAVFGEAVESLRYAVDAWKSGETNRVLDGNTLTALRTHLAGLPDNVTPPATTQLAFITDVQLRDGLRLDIASADRSFGVGDWKGCTVVAGSVAEAVLLWAVDQHEVVTPGRASAAVGALVASGTFTRQPPVDRDQWNLFHLIEVAHHLQLIGKDTAAQCRIAKEFRNLIHPGRAKRLAQSCDRGTALSALAAVEHMAIDLE